MSRRAAIIVAAIALVAVAAFVLVVMVPRWYAPKPPDAAPVSTAAPASVRKITATLFYISEDGLSLAGAKREVPFGEPIVEQARRIVEAQLLPAPRPLASAIPDGTTLRSLFLTDRGDAFV